MIHLKFEPTILTTIIAGAVLLQCFATMVTEARPTVEDNSNTNTNAVGETNSDAKTCRNSPDIRNVCEMCAKVTKSRLAYPMCCAPNNYAETRTWCLKFLNFGLTHEVWSFP